MGLLIKVPVLIGLILLLVRTKNAVLCAGPWAGITLLLALMFALAFNPIVLLWAGATFLLALGYFVLIDHLEEKESGWWWVAMPIGALILIGVF
jgi:hypothetical protein